MCMLTFLPPGVLPNVERLRNGTVSNRDGHGWAIVVQGGPDTAPHILTGHSMNPDAAIEAFRLTREQHPEGPALFHSRYTTGGLVDESNCHPYVVNGDPRTILAHNGVLPYSLKQPHSDERSDTRYFCDEYGALLYPGSSPGVDFNLNSKRGQRRLRDWLGNPNKFVVLTVDPTFKRSYFVVNSNQGIWEDDGCWYSNTGYKQKTYGIGTVGTGWSDDDYGYGYRPWWKDAETGVTSPVRVTSGREGNVWTRLASSVRGMFDKGVVSLPPDTDLTCEVCGAKDAVVADLNYCRLCGTCGDCFGDALDEYGDYPCECAWPTGTHPGRKRRVESAFAEREDFEATLTAAIAAARGEGDTTLAIAAQRARDEWPTDIGPTDDGTAGAEAARDVRQPFRKQPFRNWVADRDEIYRSITSTPHRGEQ